MIISMTGFGNAEVSLATKRVHVSVKSVNGKNADLSIRLPHLYKDKENEVRSLIQDALKRGKIDLNINFEQGEEDSAMHINKAVMLSYMDQMRDVTSGMDDIEDDDLLSIVSRFPNVVGTERSAVDEGEWLAVMEGVKEAIDKLQEFRKGEGEKLEADLRQRIENISSFRKAVGEVEGERATQVREKLMKQLDQLSLSNGVDKDRFEQELIYFLERLDITEELVRLDAHLQLFSETLSETDSQGKKLSFISQEIGREINTIGSKANHFGIQKIVVSMKDELEKIKEQLFNIL